MRRRNFISGAVAAIAGLCGVRIGSAKAECQDGRVTHIIGNPFNRSPVFGVTDGEAFFDRQLVHVHNGEKPTKDNLFVHRGPCGIVPPGTRVACNWHNGKWYIVAVER